MKKTKLCRIVLAAVVIVVVAAVINALPHKPCAHLKQEDVVCVWADVVAYEKYPLPQEAADKVVAALQKLTAYRRDDDYIAELTGSPRMWFVVELKSGEMISVRAVRGACEVDEVCYVADESSTGRLAELLSEWTRWTKENGTLKE